MQRRFEILTKHILQLKNDNFGEWVFDNESDGTAEHPIHMPYIDYSEAVNTFIECVYQFMEVNHDLRMDRYSDVLKENGLEWKYKSMSEADTSSLNAQCIVSLIMGAIRADRFNEGVLLNFFTDGCIVKWLERLKEIDASQHGKETYFESQ